MWNFRLLRRSEAAEPGEKATGQEGGGDLSWMLDQMPLPIWCIDLTGTDHHFNQAWRDLLGWDASLSARSYVQRLIHPDERADFWSTLGQARANGTHFSARFRALSPSGAFLWIGLKGSPFKSPEGTPLGYILSCIDVSETEKLEKKLSDAQEFLGTVLERLPVALFCKDLQDAARYSLWNGTAERLFGIRKETVLGKTDSEVFPAEVAERFGADDIEAIRQGDGQEGFESLIRRMDGTEACIHTVRVPVLGADGKPRFILGIAQDITERKAKEEALAEEKAKLEQVTSSISDVIWMSDPRKQQMIYISPAYDKVWEEKGKDLLQDPMSFIEVIHPDDRDRVIAALPKQLDGSYEENYRLLMLDGRVKWIHSRAFPIRNETGEVIRVVGIETDITERKLQEKVILEQKEQLETIFEKIPIMLAILDVDGRIEWVNPEFTKVFGWPLEEIRGKRLVTQVFPGTENLIASVIWTDFVLKTKNGDHAPTSWRSIQLSFGRTVVIGQDLSLRRAQELIIQDQQLRIVTSAKLSSLGEMAGNVAHEINNPLSVIVGTSHQLARELEGGVSPEDLREGLDCIKRTAQRISKIIKGLRAFSRNGENDPFVVAEVSQIIEETLELCRQRFSSRGVELRTRVESGLQLNCRPVQISQVLLNLLNNAFDAVEASSGEKWVEVQAQVEEGWMSLGVIDSGPGVPSELVPKIMEPFFTTKPRGVGTGLGLSISRGIIEEHGGTIEYDTNSGRSRFVCRIPLRDNTGVSLGVERS